ncbi:phage protein NinX family protein [Flavobacterium sp.]|uniref:phage protein NinX family protein n=1 Tax=Flavobacterium sp. TaxID=239 RepID=UPI002638CB70|nr:phage protein NinX family protein [Flavobacterium sp.]
MKFNSKTLSGNNLILAVAITEGVEVIWDHDHKIFLFEDGEDGQQRYDPTISFEQAGPIRVREKMWIRYPFFGSGEVEAINGNFLFPNIVNAFGPDELIASMRCLIASKHGEVIEIPDHLIPNY